MNHNTNSRLKMAFSIISLSYFILIFIDLIFLSGVFILVHILEPFRIKCTILIIRLL